MATITPVLTNFVVAPRVYGTAPFDLTNPVSTNTNPVATFTFTSSNVAVADISGRTVTIVNAGQTVITATQAATTGYSLATITANFTVNIATPTISGFTIAPKSFGDISFGLTDPSSNSAGVFSFRSLTTDTITVSGRVATIKSIGLAQIEVIQFPATNYARGNVVAEFDVLTSIVRVGVQNQIDLSWNIPIENGATIKNYFFYVEERIPSVVPAPAVSTVVSSINPIPIGYYSYALPLPYSAQILASGGSPTGIDVNSTLQFNINTSPQFTNKNYIDLGYYGEIEIAWEYHNDRPIVPLNPELVASTTMTISLWKESSATEGDRRVNLLFNNTRIYDSISNCLGPMPQNNNKTITDIYNVEFDNTANRELKVLKPTDILSGSVRLSSVSYSPADAPASTREYSIIVKSIRIVPFRFPITRDFTSLGFGLGSSAVGAGFVVSSANASAPLAAKGILYHMPKMMRDLSDFNEASWSFSWNYAANLARLATDISYLPISGGNITNLNIPFTMRVRGYSRPYARVLAAITVEEYNTTNVSNFLVGVGDARYHTRILFDVSLNYNATYSQITGAGTTTAVFDISGAAGFQDTSHTQFVFLFQLTITDPSYNAYFRSLAAAAADDADVDVDADAFQVKMLSQTFTPRQEYRFEGPDPTLASSNSLTSMTNTLYNISNPYTNVPPFYRFYGLTNGSFYSFKISSNNIVGTTAFSQLFTRRCGSVPNDIMNTVNSDGADTLKVESENTSNQVNIYWVKPVFSGYEIQYFVIQMNIDVYGRWLNILDYTPDISHNTITFDTFQDTTIIITNHTITEYDKTINSYIYKTSAQATEFTQQTGISVGVSGPLINGYKYYFRIASVNELGYSNFTPVLTGIPFARPNNSPIQYIGNHVPGDKLVYLTWKIPDDDAGSPILNYIIDYEEVTTIDGVDTYANKRRYKLDNDEPMENKRPSYPFDDFRAVYSGYKRFALLSEDEQKKIAKLRAELTRYIIPPTPITINDSDYNLSPSLVENRNVRLSYLSQSFTFISAELTQNVFDISNIQLKWYYFNDPIGAVWNDDITTVSFRMSMRGHLKAVAGSAAQDISNIFFISGDTATGGVTYTVSRPKLSEFGTYKYIDYTNGNIIAGGGAAIPKIFIPTLPSVDASNNSQRYRLQIDYQITYLSPGANRFILYSGPIIINGTAPVRTGLGINTRFTLKLQDKTNSPIENRKYRFTITPFNINDYFPDNTPRKRSQVTLTIGITNSEPIADMSYTLISTSLGGKVRLQWRYSSPSDYYINIEVPKKYQNSNFPQEYPMLSDGEITRSILVSNLTPIGTGNIVSFTIPSDNPADIAANNTQLYLKSGRQYTISVSPVRIVEINNAPESLVAESRNMTPDDVYIVPFRVPLRPLLLTAQGNPGAVMLKWKLPNIAEDPNFYISGWDPTYYRYRYYTLERRDISANSSPDAPWTVVAPELEIPAPENGGVFGYETAYTVSGLINENNQQIRVRLMIINDYNGARTFSEWTHMSVINNVAVPESSGNIIYPSVYPYKPSAPVLQFADRTTTALGTLNGLSINFIYPTYNGNADYYECEVSYTPVGSFGGEWRNIFSVSDGIANIADNTAILVGGKIRTSGAVGGVSPGSQQITVVCKSAVLAYGIRIRVIGRKTGLTEPYPYVLYSDYSVPDYIEI